MFEEKIIAFGKFVGSLILLFVTVLLVLIYSIALSEKIEKPTFKNLSAENFIIYGIVIVLLVFLNFLVFRTLKKQRENFKSNSMYEKEKLKLEISDYTILSNGSDGGHKYLATEILKDGKVRRLTVFFENKFDEEKLQNKKSMKVVGELIDDAVNQDLLLRNSRIID